MKIQATPDYLVFADEPKTNELLDFPDVKRGWGIAFDQTQGKPPLQWMNGAFNRIDKNILYMLQQGVPEWNAAVLYPVNAIIKYKGVLYTATVQNDNAIPSTNAAKWSKAVNIKDASLTQKGIVQLSSKTGSNDEKTASTPKATKAAYDLAAGAVKKSGDTMTGALTGTDITANNITAKTALTVGGAKATYSDGGLNFNKSLLINNAPALKQGDGGLLSYAPTIDDMFSSDITTGFYRFDKTAVNTPVANSYGYINKIAWNANEARIMSYMHNSHRTFTGFKDKNTGNISFAEFITSNNVSNFAYPTCGLLNNTDLNTLTGSKFGFYYQDANAKAPLKSNYPIAFAGSLVVYQNRAEGVDGCTQKYNTYKDNREFVRSYSPSQKKWSAWIEVLTTANIKKHVGAAYVTETYTSADGFSWYRKWSDGWIEQGGFITITQGSSISTVNLPTPFTLNNYTVNATLGRNDGLAWYPAGSTNTYSLTTKNFLISVNATLNSVNIYWRVSGK